MTRMGETRRKNRTENSIVVVLTPPLSLPFIVDRLASGGGGKFKKKKGDADEDDGFW
jgi:hypothetical protein